MSEISLNSNTFRATGKYLNLLIDFVAECKTRHEGIDEERRKALVALLSGLCDCENIDPDIQMVSVIVEYSLIKDRKKLLPFVQRLIHLLDTTPTNEAIVGLDRIIGALNFERSQALAKINGRHYDERLH